MYKWFKQHLNWTWIIVFVLALGLFRYFNTPRLIIYTDNNYTIVLNESDSSDFSKIQWSPDLSESKSPYRWVMGQLTYYLSNVGTAAVDVNITNTEGPGLAQPGISASSDTVTVQPNERKPIVVTIHLSPDVTWREKNLNLYFHTSEGNTNLVYQIPSFIIMGFFIVTSGWVLRQKNRSLWYLLLLGIWSPLWLSNKKLIESDSKLD